MDLKLDSALDQLTEDSTLKQISSDLTGLVLCDMLISESDSDISIRLDRLHQLRWFID